MLARAFQNISDPSQRGALERAIFGRGGTGLGRMLAEAGGDFDALIARLTDAGKITESELVARGDAFGDRIAQAGRQIETVMNPQLVRSGELMAGIVEGSRQPRNERREHEVARAAAWGVGGVAICGARRPSRRTVRATGLTGALTELAGGQAGHPRRHSRERASARRGAEAARRSMIGALGFAVEALQQQVTAQRVELARLERAEHAWATRSPLHDNLGPVTMPGGGAAVPLPRLPPGVLDGVSDEEYARQRAEAERRGCGDQGLGDGDQHSAPRRRKPRPGSAPSPAT